MVLCVYFLVLVFIKSDVDASRYLRFSRACILDDLTNILLLTTGVVDAHCGRTGSFMNERIKGRI